MQSHFLAFHFDFQTAFNVNDKLPKVKKKGIFLSQWIGKKGRFSVAFRQAAQSICGCQRKSFSYSVKTDSVFTERTQSDRLWSGAIMLSAKLCSAALHNPYRKPFNATTAFRSTSSGSFSSSASPYRISIQRFSEAPLLSSNLTS